MAAAHNPMDLTGATVLVTGASSGIGRETAILLSRLNARVVLVGRNGQRLEATLVSLAGQGHHVSAFDLCRVGEIPAWIRTIVSHTGPLRGLVHAAGKQTIMPIRYEGAQAADELLKTNLQSAIMLAKGFCHRECHEPGSSIVFLSSILGITGLPSMSVYSASKAALLGFSKSLAVELAPEDIRVNCIAPACVQTELLDQVREFVSPAQFDALEKSHPLGFGRATDIANAVAFLIAGTGRWITGSTLVVDGGYSAH